MIAFVLCLLFCNCPPSSTLSFDAITLDQANRLNGQRHTITLTVGRPVYTFVVGDRLRTICGPAEIEGDDQERTVSLRGNRLGDVDVGTKLRITGTLRVLHHAECRVNDVTVPAWAEIRFEED